MVARRMFGTRDQSVPKVTQVTRAHVSTITATADRAFMGLYAPVIWNTRTPPPQFVP